MSNIDKQAVQAVADLKAGYTLGHADVAILNELARIALASLEAEPVGTFRKGPCGYSPSFHEDAVPLYAAPLVPVVPEEATPEKIEILASTFAPRGVTYQWDRDECNAAADSWNACRTAMLQGADGNSPVIPDGWVACSERMPEEGEIVLTSDGTSINLGESERSGVNLRFFTSIISGRELPATHWMPLPNPPKE